MTPFVLDEGNAITLTANGADSKGNPRPTDPNTQTTWAVDKTGIVAVSPQAGTGNCLFSFIPNASGGLVTVTATSKSTNGTVISGTAQIQCNPAQATQLILTAQPEVPLP